MPQEHTLVVEIDAAGLRALGAGEARLAIGKSVGSAPPSAAWLAWVPSGSNTIVWSETYGVFAARVPGASAAPLQLLASVHPAAERTIYPFLGDAFAEPSPAHDIPRRHYDVRNDAPFAAAFGLLQAATLNGAAVVAPVNAVVLPPGFIADFSAMAKLYVWAQRGPLAGAPVAHVPADAAVVEFAPGDAAKHYRYDSASAVFVPSWSRRTT
jgi:hypothetical protein